MADSTLTNFSWKFFIASCASLVILKATESWWNAVNHPPTGHLSGFYLIPIGHYLYSPETPNNGTPSLDWRTDFGFPVFGENLAIALLIVAAVLYLYPDSLKPEPQPDIPDMSVRIIQFQHARTQTPFRLVKPSFNTCHSPAGQARAREVAALRKRIATLSLAAKAKAMKLQLTTVSKEKMVGFLLVRHKGAEKDLGELRSIRDHERLLLEKQREENRCLNNAIMKRMEQIGRWYDRA